MSTPASPGSTIPLPPLPRCPYCEVDLTAINGFPYMIGPYTVLSVACGHCRMALHFQIFQNPPPLPGEETRVHIPS